MTALTVREQVDLRPYNTLAVSSVAAFYCQAHSAQDLESACRWANERGLSITLLGGGSNVVLQPEIAGLVVHNRIPGYRVEALDSQHSLVHLGAGESWHAMVRKTLGQGLYGLENLSLIPGTVGAAPVQNIGAYGVELKDLFWSATAFDRVRGQWVNCSPEFCEFGYRDSLFKRHPGRYLISSVSLRLCHEFRPVLDYGPLVGLGHSQGIGLTGLQLSDFIAQIRSEKLPNPTELPNAGSFFKNPIIDQVQFAALKQTHPDVVAYPSGDAVKLAAGWLIERAGFKGYQDAQTGVGMHSKQALVLVNPQQADAGAIMAMVGRIQQAVVDTFGVHLEVEPVQIGEASAASEPSAH